ncbi:TRAP transporter small permease [Brevibacterium casei]|uniref:TRAP-type C4-dicarboxylate transport system, small permease component n=1 Tax=Brevibacterium casei CIP 102111 TaxID=1255625 RepID=A0A2H1HT15_9MICO|nr:TRAP transporter small permease [Brevibacterium casei]MCT1551981.1 TRAP transporter small permease [Brevibacterium casei]MCT1561810.1 TRAP transporter small permease [Brevibacterium casei]MCT2206653.1 TRAP transporter small permease [Brevibacterium casei]QPR38396.1 TRAP transporter small permease [Brevibacterium casei]QPR42562.1 TRAP transporter small permease [Brevibacterium casei]
MNPDTPGSDTIADAEAMLAFDKDSFERRSALYRWAISLERAIGILLMVGVFALVLLQVITRYVFDSPLSWTEEVARLTLVWLTFLAAAYVTSRRSHITVDLIATVVPRRVARAIGTFARLVVLAVSAFMAVAGIMMVDIVAAIAMPASGLPTALLYLAATIGFILIFIHTIIEFVMVAKHPDENPDTVDTAAHMEGL